MQVQLTVQLDEGPVQILAVELSVTAQELEKQVLELMQRTGRIVLEHLLQQASLSVRALSIQNTVPMPLRNRG